MFCITVALRVVTSVDYFALHRQSMPSIMLPTASSSMNSAFGFGASLPRIANFSTTGEGLDRAAVGLIRAIVWDTGVVN